MKSQVNVPNEWEKTGFCCCVVYPKRKAPFESLLLREKPFLLSYQQKTKLFCNMTVYENTCFYLYFIILCRSDSQVSQMPSLISKPPWILRYLFPPGRVTRYGIRPISTDWSAINYDRFKKLFKGNSYKSFATRWIKALQQRSKANFVSGKWYSFFCN